jgi:DNA-binding transcriptional regulator YiaG
MCSNKDDFISEIKEVTMSDMISEWSHKNIRSLRLRLGWSQADLARRLSCTSADVELWEHGEMMPNPRVANELILISKQADACSHEVHSCPIAESVCDRKALGQIGLSDVKEDIEF